MIAETKIVSTVALNGLEVISVEVQVQVVTGGRPSFILVGLPDKAVAESRERIRSALVSMGISLPSGRVTVNLSPADLQKEGSLYDVPITVAILVAMGQIDQEDVMGFLFLGELSLDGRFNAVNGVLPAAIYAQEKGLGIVCPKSQETEAGWAGNASVLGVERLYDLVRHFQGIALIPFAEPPPPREDETVDTVTIDLKDIKGQRMARRALEIAAAGEHNLLMNGSPGVGKSLLAKSLPGILPPMTAQEILDVSMIYSVAGLLPEGGLVYQRPFRDPHHSASLPSLVGGGTHARPGEVSLSHRGVLFLDELPEFQRATLEALRQPLENGVVQVSRVKAVCSYPAGFQLVAAMNPCRCGYLHDPARVCSKAPLCAEQYLSRISGPFLDRIDLHVEVPRVSMITLHSDKPAESSAVVRQRVVAARQRQYDRYGISISNARIPFNTLESFLFASNETLSKIQKHAHVQGLSMRSYHRILRVARTIADLGAREAVEWVDVEEALAFRGV